MRIKDVLHTKGDMVVTVDPEATVRELLDLLADHNIGAVVVSADGTTVSGIVSERDVVRALVRGVEILDSSVGEIMTEDVRTVVLEDTVDGLMRLMTEHRIRHVPVLVDGELHGIISIGDVVKSRIGELEFERDQLTSYVAGTQ